MLVKDGRMPTPKRINSPTVWDRLQLDEAFTAIPSNYVAVNPWDEITASRVGDHANWFRYIIEDRDRHGNIRVYVRVTGRRKVRIRAPFGTDKFPAAYNAAVSEHVSAPRQARAAKTGSFRHVCVLHYASAAFKRLDPATQSWRRRALDSV
jgi:hypothetical protein